MANSNENTENSNAKKSKKGKTAFILILIIAITLILVVVISNSKKSGGQMRGMQGTGQAANIEIPVRSMEAQPVTLKDYVITNGDVETQTSIEVFPSIGGNVVEMNVQLGSPVQKGDVIARIDASEAGTYYSLSPVVAPISGSILSSPVKTGSKVSVSSVITTIGDIENLQITANVPERFVASLVPGLKAEIQLEAYPDVVFNATVVRVSPVLDSATRTKEVILTFDQKDSRVNAGMFAKVKLFTNDYSGKIAVPQDALVTNNDDQYLFVVKSDNTVERRLVTTGHTVDSNIQILSGIEFGERVVIEGMLSLYDGAKVKDIAAN